jgi:hypothetical protein
MTRHGTMPQPHKSPRHREWLDTPTDYIDPNQKLVDTLAADAAIVREAYADNPDVLAMLGLLDDALTTVTETLTAVR